MAEKSNIQWTDATWNIARGCTKVDSDCKFCYMYRESARYKTYNPQQVTRTKTVFNMPLKYPALGSSRVWDGPPLIFTSSLTDWAHEAIDSYRHEMFDIIRRRPDLTFQLLTKRPERLLKIMPSDWGKGYRNIWLGTSVGSNDAGHRITELLHNQAAIRFLSLEPLHGPIDINDHVWLYGSGLRQPVVGWKYFDDNNKSIGIDWVIVGGESGNENGKYRYRECKIEWIEDIISQCQAAGIPVFVKQLGTHLAKAMGLKDRHGGDINEWPRHLQIRQMPRV